MIGGQAAAGVIVSSDQSSMGKHEEKKKAMEWHAVRAACRREE